MDSQNCSYHDHFRSRFSNNRIRGALYSARRCSDDARRAPDLSTQGVVLQLPQPRCTDREKNGKPTWRIGDEKPRVLMMTSRNFFGCDAGSRLQAEADRRSR